MLRSFAKFFAVLAVAIAAIAVFSRTASAQAPIPNACCTFTVDAAGFNPACFPVKLTTRWTGILQTDVVPGNGVFTYNINPCPPVPAQFGWASLDGGVTTAWWNFPANFKVNGCCFTLRIATDAAGCIIVYMRPC